MIVAALFLLFLGEGLPRIFRFGYGLALYVQYAVAKVAQFTKQTSAESRGATFTAKDGVNMQYGHVAEHFVPFFWLCW